MYKSILNRFRRSEIPLITRVRHERKTATTCNVIIAIIMNKKKINDILSNNIVYLSVL